MSYPPDPVKIVIKPTEPKNVKDALAKLEQLRVEAEHAGQDETQILDIMDFVSGWCSPQERI